MGYYRVYILLKCCLTVILPLAVQGTTEPPPRLSERDLIAKMEAHGIGTDATVAEHIQKQLERGYAEKDEGALTFWPTPLGAHNQFERE